MREEYDFSTAVKNPYIKHKTKQQITINLDTQVIYYFKTEADRTGIPYQTLIDLYLSDCAARNLHPEIRWNPS